jgi:hypothetical protein
MILDNTYQRHHSFQYVLLLPKFLTTDIKLNFNSFSYNWKTFKWNFTKYITVYNGLKTLIHRNNDYCHHHHHSIMHLSSSQLLKPIIYLWNGHKWVHTNDVITTGREGLKYPKKTCLSDILSTINPRQNWLESELREKPMWRKKLKLPLCLTK